MAAGSQRRGWGPDGHVSELTVAFPLKELDAVVETLDARKAHNRRPLSPKVRAVLTANRFRTVPMCV
jgi:hypothetical protein